MEGRQIALNEVIVASREAADRYRDEAKLIDDTTLVQVFEQLAEEREALSRELRDHVHRLGALPRAPDADSEQAHKLVTRLKTRLSSNEPLTIIEERLDAEARLAALLDAALQHDLPASAMACLEPARKSVDKARRRLAELRDSRQG